MCIKGVQSFSIESEENKKKRINITQDEDVIKRVDHYAEQHYTTRSGAITMLIVDATKSVKVKKKNNKGR